MFTKDSSILFTGDSITDCGRNREELTSCGDGYAYMLKSRFLFEQPDKNLTILNKGISGNRIVDIYARIKEDCINLAPDILSILIGVNDVWHEFSRGQGVSAEKFQFVYSLLLNEIVVAFPGIKLVLMEPFVLAGGLPVGDYDTWRAEMAVRQGIVKELAKTYSAVFVPLQQPFEEACSIATDTYWLYDGVHPTCAGHMLIADRWIKAVKQ